MSSNVNIGNSIAPLNTIKSPGANVGTSHFANTATDLALITKVWQKRLPGDVAAAS